MASDFETVKLHFGKGERPAEILGHFANRHGLITGATGTGKTVTVQVLAENFSRLGVPVFVTDVKGDVSGLSQAGKEKEKLIARAEKLGVKDYKFEGSSTVFWDIYRKYGHPVRTTLMELGPMLLGRFLELSDVQEGVLNVGFKMAQDEKLALLDLKDLQQLLSYMGDNYQDVSNKYGRVTSSSIGAIQRRLLKLEQQGAEMLLGEPAIELSDLMKQDLSGNGIISIMDSRDLIQNPQMYATFMLWLMTELFESLPEVGDQPLPKLILFFDEAHLIFNDAPKALLQKIEQVARLVRSKGVGIYFCTQSPGDVPETILGQLANKVQHALRSYTPKDQKVIRAAAESFRPNPKFDTEEAITQLGVGEALVSTLDENGAPSVVDWVKISPPRCRMGPANDEERKTVMSRSPIGDKYDDDMDKDSAFEKLQKRQEQIEKQKKEAEEALEREKADQKRVRGRRGDTFIEAAGKTVVRRFGTKIVNALWKSFFGKR
ncbi:MAG: helicase HerA-like domain-containing protein [Gammaproteobacteria bacterium]